MKKIIICADDFSQNEDISQGILKLLTTQRINATSCMTNTEYWTTMSPLLHPLKTQAYIGLHFNLTQGSPLSSEWKSMYGEQFFSLAELIRKSYTISLDPTVLRAELHAQWEKFRAGMNQDTPDFIDGHQHIHQLPEVSAILIEFCKSQATWKGFIRQTYNGCKDWFNTQAFPKPQMLAILGGMQFKKILSKNRIPHNTSFGGIIYFNNKQPFSRNFSGFLQKISDNGLIMCHPGCTSQDTSDPLYKHRSSEFAYFQSDSFLKDLSKWNVVLKNKL